MIPESFSTTQPPAPEPAGWRRELAAVVSDPGELLGLLGLPAELLPAAERAARLFPLRVPRAFVARMRPGDARDPLLLQVLPLGVEEATVPGFTTDPLGELGALPARGVLHKYRGRALLVLTGACAIHCRYCFRRHFPYPEAQTGASGWEAAVAYVAADPSIEEVLLSGGDPLALPDERLARLAECLAAVPHVRRLRVHSRLPVVLPARVDADLLRWLAGSRLEPVMVIHANHAAEIDQTVAAAIERLRRSGVTVLNQAVLLAGINDSVAAQSALSRALFAAGALPYYLHLLDRVQGAAHFEVGEEAGRAILRGLRAELPGYLVPKLVREVAGEPSKLPIAD